MQTPSFIVIGGRLGAITITIPADILPVLKGEPRLCKELKELKVPILRLAVIDVPIPFSEPLENAIKPSVKSLYEEAKRLVIFYYHQRITLRLQNCSLN